MDYDETQRKTFFAKIKPKMILFRSAMSYTYSKARGRLNQYEKDVY